MRTLVEEFFNGNLETAIAKLPSRAERIAAYESAMNTLLDPRHAPWPSDGQPGDMGDRVHAMMDTPVEVRIANMTAAKLGCAYAEAQSGVERGYAIGAF